VTISVTGVLDLHARVHLEEIQLALLVHDELERPERRVARLEHRLAEDLGHGLADRSRHGRAGRFFDELLVTTLQRAFALAQGPDPTVKVGQHLKLDVAGALDELLAVHVRVLESGLGFAPRTSERVGHLRVAADDSHSATPASTTCLDDDRIPHALRLADCVVGAREHATARQQWQAEPLGVSPGRDLVAPGAHGLGAGSDERDAALPADAREFGVLREKPVAGMNGVRGGDLGRADDCGDVEIALRRGAGTDADRLVGEANMQRSCVDFGVNGDGLDAELPAGPQDAERNFTSVRNQDLFEHRRASAAPGYRARERDESSEIADRNPLARRGRQPSGLLDPE
jgi:hypothetical protein